jgi:hypothetical protein
MSSRILQEDSSLLLTEANEPLVNENFIATDGFSTGSPVVSPTAITQVHIATVLDITTGLPVVDSTLLTQDHNLVSLGVVSDNPSIPPLALVQDHSLGAVGITTEVSEVTSVTMVEEESAFADPILTGSTLVSATALSQNHTLSPTNIRTRSPIVETADDPNYIVKQEIEELQQMFGGWQRRAYEVPDGKLVQAEREIQSTFGDVVSIDKKAKSLIKFGKSKELNAGVLETVWPVGGNEIYVDTNAIDSISSSNVNDTQEVYMECHTVEGTGLDQKFTFMTQVVTLNGQNRVPLPSPVARVSRVYNNNGTELQGQVYVYQDTAITAGVPTDITKVHALIPQGFQQSFKGATTFSDEDYYILTGGFGSVSNKQAANVDFYLEVRTAGKIFRQGAAVSAASTGGSWVIELDPAIIIPKNSDIRIRCEASTNGAVVFSSFKGYLAKVIG